MSADLLNLLVRRINQMELQDHVILMGQRWSIKRTPLPGNSTENMGICDNFKRTIEIKTDLHPEAELDTLLHEIAHAYQFMLDLPHIPDEAWETIVQLFSIICIDVNRNNAWVTELLAARGQPGPLNG